MAPGYHAYVTIPTSGRASLIGGKERKHQTRGKSGRERGKIRVELNFGTASLILGGKKYVTMNQSQPKIGGGGESRRMGNQ